MISVIVIFDLGRTHKKFFIFDKDYKVIDERSVAIADIKDEDGDVCEDVDAIAAWMREQLYHALQKKEYDIKGINFSAHGASFVHMDKAGNPVTPLYDYMKGIDNDIIKNFYKQFGGKNEFSVATGSPALNMLNSGIQLYWLKYKRPDLFKKINTSLHLPQYGNYLFTQKIHSDMTSIGCHTGLWDFNLQQYHQWLQTEQLQHLLPEAEEVDSFDAVSFGDKNIAVGIGIHDSSAALLPFVKTADKPFVLLSTGTWNITLNPYFEGNLNEEDYGRDCLYYLLDRKRKVAASRLFLGNEYDHQVKKLESYFHKRKGYFESVRIDKKLLDEAIKKRSKPAIFYPETMQGTGPFPGLKSASPDLSQFESFEAAYHRLMLDLVYLQKISIELVCDKIKRLYISGGFLKSVIFMELLQAFLPDWEICIVENKRASALGAAVALHEIWQTIPLSASVSPVVRFKKSLDLDISAYSAFRNLVKIHNS